VWENFIQPPPADISAITDVEIRRLAGLELYGRQTKTVVKIAGLLAADSGGKLMYENLETISRNRGWNGIEYGLRKMWYDTFKIGNLRLDVQRQRCTWCARFYHRVIAVTPDPHGAF
jgi:hypothetical protein